MISSILLCGGRGTRMGGSIPKQFLQLGGKAVVLHSYEIFCKEPTVSEIIIVCEPEFQDYFPSSCEKRIAFANPGERRQDSVYHGFQKISKDSQLVVIHDSARPFISQTMLQRVCESAWIHGAATIGVPLKFTIKETCSNQFVIKTINREAVFEIQTPQVIQPQILKKGFQKALKENITVTDDVSLVELVGHPVKVVEGSPLNLKITTPEDLRIAESFLQNG